MPRPSRPGPCSKSQLLLCSSEGTSTSAGDCLADSPQRFNRGRSPAKDQERVFCTRDLGRRRFASPATHPSNLIPLPAYLEYGCPQSLNCAAHLSNVIWVRTEVLLQKSAIGVFLALVLHLLAVPKCDHNQFLLRRCGALVKNLISNRPLLVKT